MDITEIKIEKMNASELEKVNGGGIFAAAAIAAGIYGAVVAGAAALGYADGKDDCPPPPCT